MQPTYDANKDNVKKNTKIGLLDFSKVTARKPIENLKPYPIPEGYDFANIEKAYTLLSDFKKPKLVPSIEKSYPRDN